MVFTRYFGNSLYRNSFFLIGNSVVSSVAGFAVRIVAARFYSTADYGFASAIIAATNVVHLLALAGLDMSLAHYLPNEEHDKHTALINTCMTLGLILSTVIGAGFALTVNAWSPALGIISVSQAAFLFFTGLSVLTTLTGIQSFGVFIGLRKAEYSFLQGLSSLSKLALLPLLACFSMFGILGATAIGSIVMLVAGYVMLSRSGVPYRPAFAIHGDVLKKVSKFSFATYIAKILEVMPDYLFPILVINVLGAEATASFTVVWTVCYPAFMIVRMTSMSLFAESSAGAEARWALAKEASKLLLLLSIPATAGVLALGGLMPFLFGSQYGGEAAMQLVLVFVASWLPFSVNRVFATVLMAREETGRGIFIYAVVLSATLIAAIWLLPVAGIVGIGEAWFVANAIGAGLAIIEFALWDTRSIKEG